MRTAWKIFLASILCFAIVDNVHAMNGSNTPPAQAPAESTFKKAKTAASDILMQGMSGAIAQTLSSFMVDTLRATARGVYAYGCLLGSLGRKGFNTACRRPEPLDAEQLRLFLHLVEEHLNTLTEQPLSDAIVFKSMRVEPDAEQLAETHEQWVFLVDRVDELFSHIIVWINTHTAYYQVTPDQRTWLARLAWGCSTTQRESIIFISQLLVKNLGHLAKLSKAASSADDLDTVHIKKVGRATLLYFKKLIQLVGNTQDTALVQPYTSGTNFIQGMSSNTAY